ncbi:MAG: hypothetical protein U0Q16_03530 [Bryobacteraceae bacterium]
MNRNPFATVSLVCAFCSASALYAQTFTAELDPDLYFDRGVTLALGAKPSPGSRFTLLGDFASRKISTSKHERLDWRAGGGARCRLVGQRSNLFAQLDLSIDQITLPGRTVRGPSVRPGAGVQWFPWKQRGFYTAPLVAFEHYPGIHRQGPRGEIRVGWQFNVGR